MKTSVAIVSTMLVAVAFLPLAAASGPITLSICDPTKTDAVNRAKCAAYDTAQNVLDVADPILGYAGAEAGYWAGVICAILDHEIGGHNCQRVVDGLAFSA